MKKIGLVILIVFVGMIFVPLGYTLGPVQPPLDTQTLYKAAGAWGPIDADPAYAWDTTSGEILFNVYDTLIQGGNATLGTSETYWEFMPFLAANVPDQQIVTMTFPNAGINTTDPTGYVCGNLRIESWIDNDNTRDLSTGDVLFIGEYPAAPGAIQEAITIRTWTMTGLNTMVTVEHRYYNFEMRTSPTINFTDNTFAVVDTFETADAEYTLQRYLLQDQYGSPVWMHYRPLFDVMSSDGFANHDTADGGWMLAKLIDDAILDLGNDTLQINLGVAFPDIAFKQILTETWGSIMSKEWCINKGCWNGNLFEDLDMDGFPDWYFYDPLAHNPGNWRHYSAPINTVNVANYAGSGPYIAAVLSASTSLAVLQRNPNYWRGWPAAGRRAYLENINIEYIGVWTTRRDAFVNSQLDICAIPRNYAVPMLDQYGEPYYPNMKTIKYISPTTSMDAFFFVFNLNQSYSGIGLLGTSPTGIPTDFFNNTHVRKAFGYALNRTDYFKQGWYGDEATVRDTPGIAGLAPDYYTYGPNPPWAYDINETALVSELQAAMFTQGNETKSVWDWGGFKVDLYYNLGNDPRRVGCEIIQSEFNHLSTAFGKNFRTTVVGLMWSNELSLLRQSRIPTFTMGWIGDYEDASNWYEPYMGGNGDFSGFSNYTVENGWSMVGSRTGLNKEQLLALASRTPDGPERAAMYADLDDIYVQTIPNLPLAQPLGRKWCSYWVKGWEYNALWSGDYYYYHLYKEDACWADITGPTTGIPDGICNMRDIGYVAAHFGAKPPDTARRFSYDPRWAPGTYGCGGCDVYADRKIDMRDIGFACSHFLHSNEP